MISPKIAVTAMDMGYAADPITQTTVEYLLRRIVKTIAIQKSVGGLVLNKQRGKIAIIVSADSVSVGIVPVKSYVETVMFYNDSAYDMIVHDGREWYKLPTPRSGCSLTNYFGYLLWQFVATE